MPGNCREQCVVFDASKALSKFANHKSQFHSIALLHFVKKQCMFGLPEGAGAYLVGRLSAIQNWLHSHVPTYDLKHANRPPILKQRGVIRFREHGTYCMVPGWVPFLPCQHVVVNVKQTLVYCALACDNVVQQT